MHTKADVKLLARIANEFRAVETEMPVSYILALALIARFEREGLDLPNNAQIADHMGIPRASLSRVVQALGAARRATEKDGDTIKTIRKPGLGLVEKIADPMDQRMVRLRLTKKGNALLTRVADAIHTYMEIPNGYKTTGSGA